MYASRAAGDTEDFVPRLAASTRMDLNPESNSPSNPGYLPRWDENDKAFRIAGGTDRVRVGADALDDHGPAGIIDLAPALLP